MAVDLKFLQPLDYYRKYLEHNIRPDGRKFGKIRPTKLNVGSITTAEGSSIVKLGNTTAVCGIKSELTVPKPNEENFGCIVVNVELSPLCSPRFRAGPTSEQVHTTNQLLTDIITNSKCIDLSRLAIPDSKYVRTLYCDIHCMDYDGNFIDAALIALIAALENTSLPKVKVNTDTGEIKILEDKKVKIQMVMRKI